jgi:hypothetical protein
MDSLFWHLKTFPASLQRKARNSILGHLLLSFHSSTFRYPGERSSLQVSWP